MSYLSSRSFSKPLTLAAFMALGLAGCNNSSQTSTDAPADDATATETTTNGTVQKIKDSGLSWSVTVTLLFHFLISLTTQISRLVMRTIWR